jgi:hypothetical protein
MSSYDKGNDPHQLVAEGDSSMLNKTLSVQISPHLSLDENIIMLGEALIKTNKIPTNQNMILRFGSSRSQVKVISVPRFDGLRISNSLARRIGLPYGLELRVMYKAKSKILMLGPILGVMVNKVKTQSYGTPFGNNTGFCRELTDACQAEGIFVYFFSPEMLRTRGQTLEGWSYYGDWRKSAFPFPNVVYNRLTSRILENKPSVQHFMKEVKSRYKTKIFNEKYLNKTEVFQALKKDRSLHKYLPQSYSLGSFSMLNSMCSRHSTVFLKPILGSLGKGIIRISRQSNGTLACQYADRNGAQNQTYRNTAQLYAAISGKIKSRKYQIQQGLHLISIGSRPVDFRALVQKNNESQWVITSIVARIAGNHHFVSNLARGGTLSPVKEALQKSRVSSAKIVNAKLRKAAVLIAQGIESKIPQNFGELGVDLAVDKRGRVWLLEVNSKPSKNDNTPLSNNKIRPSVRQATKYVRHLAGF